MLHDELTVVEAALRSQFGDKADLRLHDRGIRTRMNLVLDRAEQELGRQFCTYWVSNGPPEIFCLRNGFSQPVIAFCPRYLELWADLRRLMVFGLSSEMKQEFIERLVLRIIAELSLTRDNPEFAASCILRAAMDSSDFHFIPNDLLSLESSEVGAGYMACWFYGLTHELGHFASLTEEEHKFGPFSDEGLNSLREHALRQIELPETMQQEVRDLAASKPGSFLMGSDVLRDEMAADVFATSCLLAATVEILSLEAEQSGTPVRWDEFWPAFISEMILSLVVIGILDRCRRTAIFACTAEPQSRFSLETVLHPAAIAVRIDAILVYLQFAASGFLFGDKPTAPQRDAISKVLDSCIEHINSFLADANLGLNRAVNVCLDRQRRPSVFEEAGRWRDGLISGQFGAHQAVVTDFLEKARGLGKWAPAFEMIQSIAQDPSAEMRMHLSGQESLFICPWVEGPDGFSRPFGLDTRHGHLIFVFASHSELFEKFSAISGEDLADGFSMKSTGILARSPRELRHALALRLPVGEPFQAVVEGTPEFEPLLLELSEGTIWPD